MVLDFKEQKELEELKHKHKLEQIKAQNDSLALEHSLKNQRLEKLLEFATKGGDLRLAGDK